MNIIIRSARIGDAYPLWLWANDEAARTASGNRAPIEWRSHRAWLDQQLESATALVFVGESAEQRPLGTIRFETDDDWATARVSYTVAPESRGRGVGRALLEAGQRACAARRVPAQFVARVQPGNAASRHLFATSGWVEDGSTPEWLRYVRPGPVAP
jgi:L-amino acid N-acyltransferase YncA